MFDVSASAAVFYISKAQIVFKWLFYKSNEDLMHFCILHKLDADRN